MSNFIKKSNSKNEMHDKSPSIIDEKISNYYDYLIINQNLVHFENLLVNKLDAIKEKYEDRMNLALFSLVLTIFGFSNDSIGFKIIKSLKIFKEINIGIWVYYIVMLSVPTFVLYKTLRVKKV